MIIYWSRAAAIELVIRMKLLNDDQRVEKIRWLSRHVCQQCGFKHGDGDIEVPAGMERYRAGHRWHLVAA